MSEHQQILQAIAALEAQRSTLGDAVVETALAPLKEKLAALDIARQQRKLVTVIFADLAGFTALSERLDPEEVREIQQAYFDMVTAPIHEQGGKVEKYIGDAILAVFGLPQAREDDPERSLRAALGMQSALAQLNERLTSARDIQLHMRVGVNTGWVALDMQHEQDFVVTGDAVNLASRLQTLAPVGGVLISHDTYQHVRGVFDVQPLEPLHIKGKAEPVQVYTVMRLKPRAFRLRTRGVEGIETRMIGRESELLALQAAYQDVVDASETRLVTIVGEAGVGKSRLLYELDNWIELRPEAVYYFKGRAVPARQRVPFSLFRDLFAYRFEILESDSTPIALDKFRRGTAGILEPEHADLVGHWIGFDFSTSEAVAKLLDSAEFGTIARSYLTHYVRAMAQRQPVVIFLEDIHWADDSSLDLAALLVKAIPEAPLLVVCLARSAFFERRPHWGEGQAAFQQIKLRPLSRRASRDLVTEILRKVDAVPDALRDLIVQSAEGNPFYLEELVKMLIDQGVIVPDIERWQVYPQRLQQTSVPHTLTGVLQARLDGLPERERKTLQVASVVGRSFWDATVAELIHEQREKVSPTLGNIRQRELIYQVERSSFTSTEEYIFKHALLRDVTYETVLLKQRRGYHALAARWLEAHAAERLGEYLGQIAEHYAQAGENELAAAYLERAGDEALRTNIFHPAREAFERAYTLLPHEAPSHCALLVKLGQACWNLSDYPAASTVLETALAEARQQDDRLQETNALYWLSQVAVKQGEYRPAQALLAESLPIAEVVGGETLARCLYGLGDAAWRLGEPGEAQLYLENSLAMARAGGYPLLVLHALNRLGTLEDVLLPEGLQTSERLYKECLALARETGNREREATALYNLGILSWTRGDNTESKLYHQACLAIDRDLGIPDSLAYDLCGLAGVSAELGEYNEAWRLVQEALAVALTVGAPHLMLSVVWGYAMLRAALGDIERALELYGLVFGHPARNLSESPAYAEKVIAKLNLDPISAQAAMQRGADLELEDVIAEIQAYPGPPSPSLVG
jgi:class 3 adenylate cyclase/tetratricopeptide (TPR) repeat protein